MTGQPDGTLVLATSIAALLIIVTICAIVFIAAALNPDGAHARTRGPRHAAEPPTVTVLPPALHHELPPFPGRLEPLPADPPPAETGEIPIATAELGMPIDVYLDQLFEPHQPEMTP